MMLPQAVSDNADAAKSKPAKSWAGRLLFFNVNHSKPSRDRSKIAAIVSSEYSKAKEPDRWDAKALFRVERYTIED